MTGAPYTVGDPVTVNGQECIIRGILRRKSAPFGQAWLLDVDLPDHDWLIVSCDDDGRNHRADMRVMPSFTIAA